MDVDKILDQYYKDAGDMAEYNEWGIQSLIIELVRSGQDKLELCELPLTQG